MDFLAEGESHSVVAGGICQQRHGLRRVEMPGEEAGGEQQLELLELLAVLRKPLEGFLLPEELPNCCGGMGEAWNEKGELLGEPPEMT